MAENLIGMVVSKKDIAFRPGGKPASFSVTIVNESDRFASFQLEVTAAGSEVDPDYEWYSISPEVSTKNPPGDLVEFHVSIVDTPVPGFLGLVNLTVRAFSMDLRDEARQVMRLDLQEGVSSTKLIIELPFPKLQVAPLDQVEIPVLVRNPSQLPTNVTLTCSGIPVEWLPNGHTRQFQVKPGGQFSTSFLCQPPFNGDTISQVYPLAIEAAHTNGLASQANAVLEVMPKGHMDFDCTPKQQSIPNKLTWAFWRSTPAIYTLYADNASNLLQKVSFEIFGGGREGCSFEVTPNEADVKPLENAQLSLNVTIKKSRPWVGNVKKVPLRIKANWQDRRADIRDEQQTVELAIKPVIPRWFLALAIALILFLLGWFSSLNPYNPFFVHKGAVTSVRFNGLSNNAISSSNDQTIKRWNTAGFHVLWENVELGVLADAGKAIRVATYRPVSNDFVAAGLENGEIQLWEITSDRKKPRSSFAYKKDDRVFGLEFTQDSRNLFSSHGSGLVLRWDVDQSFLSEDPIQPLQTQQFDFAIYDANLVGKDDSTLAIAGRFNQLVLWNWVGNNVKTVNYPRPGGQEDYIQSIATSGFSRNLLATADNQGYITLWNLSSCLNGSRNCEIVDQWSDGHGGKPVRSVSLSTNGCYLVSGGDDGRVMLWPLSKTGKRISEFLNGKALGKYSSAMNAVDIKLKNDKVLTVSGADDGHVYGQQDDRVPKFGCDRI
ncbi:WD40 repeat domain-containing protein [Tumidithrix elongata RA019]|uniref:WD40 repeat domain-containing protein n=1 Tax=Tumidithrix elongata BACA0141 TaxID=2716417 RepID=A0AAW9PVR3_9CYAN|nr:WD40 repeat domain-containing protein [Tumidithrix elongata RA019]